MKLISKRKICNLIRKQLMECILKRIFSAKRTTPDLIRYFSRLFNTAILKNLSDLSIKGYTERNWKFFRAVPLQTYPYSFGNKYVDHSTYILTVNDEKRFFLPASYSVT